MLSLCFSPSSLFPLSLSLSLSLQHDPHFLSGLFISWIVVGVFPLTGIDQDCPRSVFQHIQWWFSSKCLSVFWSLIGEREYQPHKHVKMKKISILWTKSEPTRTKSGLKITRFRFELKPTWNRSKQILVWKLLYLGSNQPNWLKPLLIWVDLQWEVVVASDVVVGLLWIFWIWVLLQDLGFVMGLARICLNFLDLSFVVVGLSGVFFFFLNFFKFLINFLDLSFVVRLGFCCYGFGWDWVWVKLEQI